MSGHMEKEEIKIEKNSDKEIQDAIKIARDLFSLQYSYEVWEVLTAILQNDAKKLQEMRNHLKLLDSGFNKFVEEVTCGDEKRCKMAMNNLSRPEK